MPLCSLQAGNQSPLFGYFDQRGRLIRLPSRWARSLRSQIGTLYSPATVRTYSYNLSYFLEWVENIGVGDVSIDDRLVALSRPEIGNWLADQLASGLARSTVCNREAAVRRFYGWLTTHEAGQVLTEKTSPYRGGKLIMKPGHSPRPRYIPTEEIIRLLKGYYNECERTLIHFIYDTGVRISEAMRLRRRDVKELRMVPDGAKYLPLRVRGSKGSAGEYKTRFAILSRPVLRRIERYHNTPEYRFASGWKFDDPDKPAFLSVNQRELTYTNVWKQMKSAARRAGLDPSLYSPHAMRHACAYSLLRSELGEGVQERLVVLKEAFGHAWLSSTETYTRAVSPAVLDTLGGTEAASDKYEEARDILDKTGLPRLNQMRRQGHWQEKGKNGQSSASSAPNQSDTTTQVSKDEPHPR